MQITLLFVCTMLRDFWTQNKVIILLLLCFDTEKPKLFAAKVQYAYYQ